MTSNYPSFAGYQKPNDLKSQMVNIVKDHDLSSFFEVDKMHHIASDMDYRIDFDVFPLCSSGLSLAHVAAFYDSLDVFKYLIENHKVLMYYPTVDAYTPLHYACRNASLRVMKYIFSNTPKQEGKQFPHISSKCVNCAFMSGSTAALQILLDYGMDLSSAKIQKFYLVSRSIYKDGGMLQFLIDNHAKIESNYQCSLISKAIRISKFDIIPILLAANQDPTVYDFNNGKNECALEYACYQEHVPTVKLLCEHMGWKIPPPDAQHATTYPVHWICTQPNLEIAKLILKCSIDVNALDSRGRAGPFKFPIITGHVNSDVVEIMELLFQHGFNLDLINKTKPSLLETAVIALCPDTGLIKWLLEQCSTSTTPDRTMWCQFLQ